MPHIILEHSSNVKGIDYQTLFTKIESALPNMGTCKIRAMSYDNYIIGNLKNENAFVFLRMLMAPLAQILIRMLKQFVKPVLQDLNLICYPTLEVGFLSKQYYWLED